MRHIFFGFLVIVGLNVSILAYTQETWVIGFEDIDSAPSESDCSGEASLTCRTLGALGFFDDSGPYVRMSSQGGEAVVLELNPNSAAALEFANPPVQIRLLFSDQLVSGVDSQPTIVVGDTLLDSSESCEQVAQSLGLLSPYRCASGGVPQATGTGTGGGIICGQCECPPGNQDTCESGERPRFFFSFVGKTFSLPPLP